MAGQVKKRSPPHILADEHFNPPPAELRRTIWVFETTSNRFSRPAAFNLTIDRSVLAPGRTASGNLKH
jgi:hypothetical protein